MKNITNEDMKNALHSINSMISRCEKAQDKFSQGTPQYTLQKNRINALKICFSLIEDTINNNILNEFDRDDLEKAIAPISSLISKSEKAQTKLKQGTWQYNMLNNNLKALNIALPLLTEVVNKL
jgi:flagellar hook-basal body complex protein FliE